jgi:hypothetical protein
MAFRIRESVRNNSGRGPDSLRIRPQVSERKGAQKVAQNSKLVAECRAAAAGAVWRGVRAILVARAERIVEMIEDAAA